MAALLKRCFDLAVAVPALCAAAPVIATLAILVKMDSSGPAFFSQIRVGRGRKPLKLFKLRSMVDGAATSGPAVTAAGDARVTRVGKWLRKAKLDELPQLWNVVKGDMSLVGPRPESPRYVDQYRPEWMSLLAVRPGLTDLASIVFRDEESLLEKAVDRDRAYVEAVLPAKLSVALEGLSKSSLTYDGSLLLKTFGAVVWPATSGHQAVERAAQAIEKLNAENC